MASVADTARFLARYSDLLVIASLLRVLTELKFGALLRSQETAAAKRRPAGEAGAAEAAGGATTVEEDAGRSAEARGPPAFTLVLLLVAELIGSWQLLDPSDRLTRRAVGTIWRTQETTAPGFSNALQAFDKVIQDADVYQLVRFVAMMAGLGSLLIQSATAALSGGPPPAGGPLGALRASVSGLLRAVLQARLWCVAGLLAAYVYGHWAMLEKVARKPAVIELVRASVGLLRASGLVAAALCAPHRGPMQTWASMQLPALAARVAHSVVYERVSLAALLAEGLLGGSPASRAAKGALALEGISALALLPIVGRRLQSALLAIALCVPCALLTAGGAASAPLDPFLPVALHRLGLGMATAALCMVFMGGFPTMLSGLGTVQLLVRIHQLDKAKF